MRYKLLGKTGLRVSELCPGTMTFGEEWGWGASKVERAPGGGVIPHDFLVRVRSMVYGNTHPLIDDPR